MGMGDHNAMTSGEYNVFPGRSGRFSFGSCQHSLSRWIYRAKNGHR